jgi:hypothetical protein
MFELGVLSLARALADGAFAGEWEFSGIGSVQGRSRVALGRSSMRLLARSDQAAYAQLLRDHDLGFALMYTPHPSLVPVEMASAGMVTVTNTFENKTPEALCAISGNLSAFLPTVEGLAAGLAQAAAAVADVQARIDGAEVSWSREWSDSFSDEMLDRMIAAMGLSE